METEAKNTASSYSTQRLTGLALGFGFIIAIPLTVFILLGKWLDVRTGHENLYTLLGVLLALITTMGILISRINRIRKELMVKPILSRSKDPDPPSDIGN